MVRVLKLSIEVFQGTFKNDRLSIKNRLTSGSSVTASLTCNALSLLHQAEPLK